jgi:hypothetical protein
LPKENGGIRLWQKTANGGSKLLFGTPNVLHPHIMKTFEDVLKDLVGFVSLWDTMANEDLLDKF